MTTSSDIDPEKGQVQHPRTSADLEPSSHSSSRSTGSSPSDEEKAAAEKPRRSSSERQQHRHQDQQEDEKEHSHVHEDLVPVATVGEPSGNKVFGDQCEPCRRTRSRASSVASRPLNLVPKSERRGWFARLAVIPEVDKPYNYKNSTKWTITATVSFATAVAPMGSSIFYPALPLLSKELNASPTITNMSVAVYMVAMSIFPLWWSSFSETLGRRTVYLMSFTLFVVSAVLCAVSTNIQMLIVFRVMAGGASASVQAEGAGTIADIWEPFERGTAMGAFYLGPLLGPLLAPIFGGILAQELGWQSTMWFLAIFGFVILIALVFLLPETTHKRPAPAAATDDLARTTTGESAVVRHTKTGARLAKRFFVDPLKVLGLLRFPAVVVTVLISAIAFGALFITNIGIQQGFSDEPYNYNQLIVGLLYGPPGVGYIVAALFGGRWIDRIMAREAKKAGRYDENGKLVYLPEDRMKENAWIATGVYPLSLLMFGWVLQYGLHWVVPSVALFFFGIASMLVFAVGTTMLTEFARHNGSAGVAVNNFVRNILSAVGTVVAGPWITAMGPGWVFTIICFFTLTASFLGIWMLKVNAQKWRKVMNGTERSH